MRYACVLAMTLAALAGCGTTTSEEYKRDPMPEIGNYPPTPATWTKVRVAINKFMDKTNNRSSHSRPVGEQAGEQFETLVIRADRFNVIERLQLENILKEQGLEGIVDPNELAKPGRIRGIDYMFMGAITNFRVKINKTSTGGGIFDRVIRPIAPLDIDTSKTTIETQVGVDIKLVNTTTGEIVAKDFGEVSRIDTASAWGVRVLGIGGDAKNELKIDEDSQGKILRWALDESFKKMLPPIDNKFSKPQPSYCPTCKVELPQNQNFCTKCGKASTKPRCSKEGCGTELEVGAKFCGKCGTKVEQK
jgi:curli biogenesis system outer membrane secretion channel CsgG